LNEEVIERSAHIVGMMGDEPISEALNRGADVVLTGRASDTSIFACVPLRMGSDRGLAWHAAKILECGAACAVSRKRPDGVFAWIRDDHFTIEPLDPEMRCTPQSVASHTLYENADPFHIIEPGGVLDTTDSTYAAEDDHTVSVRGSAYHMADRYSVKLEGAELAGYQSVIIGGVRDPYIIRQLDSWLAGMREGFAGRAKEILGSSNGNQDYQLIIRVYGRDAVMGPLEPLRGETPHEVGLLFEITAGRQETARTLASTLSHFAIHFPIPEWSGLISGIAYPFAPAEMDKGPVYRFNMNHALYPDDPCEMFPVDHEEVSA
jgi:ribosome modulation factor